MAYNWLGLWLFVNMTSLWVSQEQGTVNPLHKCLLSEWRSSCYEPHAESEMGAVNVVSNATPSISQLLLHFLPQHQM
jgi:hypothetical protein